MFITILSILNITMNLIYFNLIYLFNKKHKIHDKKKVELFIKIVKDIGFEHNDNERIIKVNETINFLKTLKGKL